LREYTIGEIAKKMEVPTSTIRFYDKHGLLSFVTRDENGRRIFTEQNFIYLEVITVLKKSGVPVDTIAEFIKMCVEGDSTLKKRLDYLDDTEAKLDRKIQELNEQKEFLKFKKWYYQTAIAAKTESIHFIPGTKIFNPQSKREYIENNDVSDNFKRFVD